MTPALGGTATCEPIKKRPRRSTRPRSKLACSFTSRGEVRFKHVEILQHLEGGDRDVSRHRAV
jgi:hypothetical protein